MLFLGLLIGFFTGALLTALVVLPVSLENRRLRALVRRTGAEPAEPPDALFAGCAGCGLPLASLSPAGWVCEYCREAEEVENG